MGRYSRKLASGFPTRPYPNQPTQLQRLARIVMGGSRKFCQMGSKLDVFLLLFFLFFFMVDEGREETNTTISVPSSPRQRNAIRWRAVDARQH